MEVDIKKLLKKNFKIGPYFLKNFLSLNKLEKKMILEWRNNENIRKWCFSNHIISYKEHQNFLKNLKSDTQNFYYLVKYKKKNLGVISLQRVDFSNKNGYLGIYSNPNLKGVGKILIKCLKKIAFEKANLHTLKLEVIEINTHAIKFYKKNKFQLEGRLREFVNREGKYLDVLIMGIINEKNKF